MFLFMSNLKRYLKELLTFAKWEQKGILMLIALIIGGVLFNLLYKPRIKDLKPTRGIIHLVDEYHKMVDSSVQKEGYGSGYYSYESYEKKYQPKSVENFFPFDPNTVTKKQLEDLGFTEKQAQVIINYRSKGGAFRSNEDFKKMFVVSAAHYKELLPFIVIANRVSDTIKRNASLYMVDINNADTSELMKLKGVGEIIAQRIVSYRNRLGGFVDVSQLLEIYGVDSSRILLFKKQLKPFSSPKLININTVSFEVLKNHPYISPYEARNVIYYRMKRGRINGIHELVANRILSKERSEKLKHYIDCTN